VFILVLVNIGDWTNQASPFTARGKFQKPGENGYDSKDRFLAGMSRELRNLSTAASALLSFQVDGKPGSVTVILPLVLNEANI
jgi:hypothetical protein